MDINILRAAITVLSFVTFIGIILWAVSPRNQSSFEQAALVPFTENDTDVDGRNS